MLEYITHKKQGRYILKNLKELFPEDFVDESYFNLSNFTYHYGDGFLYSKCNNTNTVFVLIDTVWYDVQDTDFLAEVVKYEKSFDNPNFFDDYFNTQENF